jgi:SAM-dependent methyltransferase
MKQTSTATISHGAARPEFARFSNGIPEVRRPGDHGSLLAKPAPCPANPIFGHASPIMDQHLVAVRDCPSDRLHDIPSPRQSREPHKRSKPMSKSAALNLARTTPAGGRDMPPRAASATAQLQALLHLPPGEAFDSLLKVHEILGAELPSGELGIYEAGGGSTSFLPSDVLRRAHVTVVDIDEEQLRNNGYAQKTILGDIQTYRFAPGSFDLVICYNVIEHLPDVEAALTGFFASLKRGGLALIAAPNPKSLTGFVTKYTPHWFHIWFYRHVLGKKLAGLSGEPPFPTFFHPLVTPAKLVAFAKAHGMQVVYRREHESPRFPEMRRRMPLFAALLDAFAVTASTLFRTADMRRGDYHLILRKR